LCFFICIKFGEIFYKQTIFTEAKYQNINNIISAYLYVLRIPEPRESRDTPQAQDRLLCLGNWLPLPEINLQKVLLKKYQISLEINLEHLLYSKKII
jgi:hypothetical protein